MSPSEPSAGTPAEPPDSDAVKFEKAAHEAFAAMERMMIKGTPANVSDLAIQQVVTAGARLFAGKVDREQRTFLPVVAPHAITATEAAMLASELLPAANINMFDLSVWASRPRDD